MNKNKLLSEKIKIYEEALEKIQNLDKENKEDCFFTTMTIVSQVQARIAEIGKLEEQANQPHEKK